MTEPPTSVPNCPLPSPCLCLLQLHPNAYDQVVSEIAAPASLRHVPPEEVADKSNPAYNKTSAMRITAHLQSV